MLLLAFRDANANPDQVLYPASDHTDGAWTPSTGTDLYAVLDDTTDAEYASTTSNSAMRLNLQSGSTPAAGTRTLSVRAFGSPEKKLIVRLIEGSTTVQTFTHDPIQTAIGAYDEVVTNSISNYADLDVEVEIADATTPPTLAVTWGAVGTAASGTTSCTPSYPTGISAATSKIFCMVTGRSNTASTAPTMPAGWTSIGALEGGTGTWGVDTGTRRVELFKKDAVTGTESGTVTVSLSGTTANTLRASIFRVDVPALYGIDVSVGTGADTSNDTSYSATSSTSLAFQANDLLVTGTAQNIDSGTATSRSITASGITFGTLSNRADTAVTNGNDHRHIVNSVPVSSGSGTVAPTYSYTISASGSGPTLFARMRAVVPTEKGRVTSIKWTIPASSGPTGSAAGRGGALATQAGAKSAAGASVARAAGSGSVAATKSTAAQLAGRCGTAAAAAASKAVAAAVSMRAGAAGASAGSQVVARAGEVQGSAGVRASDTGIKGAATQIAGRAAGGTHSAAAKSAPTALSARAAAQAQASTVKAASAVLAARGGATASAAGTQSVVVVGSAQARAGALAQVSAGKQAATQLAGAAAAGGAAAAHKGGSAVVASRAGAQAQALGQQIVGRTGSAAQRNGARCSAVGVKGAACTPALRGGGHASAAIGHKRASAIAYLMSAARAAAVARKSVAGTLAAGLGASCSAVAARHANGAILGRSGARFGVNTAQFFDVLASADRLWTADAQVRTLLDARSRDFIDPVRLRRFSA